MAKPCNEKNVKAKDPNYECNPKTGRWIKKKSVGAAPAATVEDCQKRLLGEFGIRIPKSVSGNTKVIFMPHEIAKFQPQRLHHEVIHFDACYFHFSWIPKNALTLKNKNWQGVKSYRDLFAVALRFMDLFPPLYPLPHRASYTTEQRLEKMKEIQQNSSQINYFAQIIWSFIKTYERLPKNSLPMPTPSQVKSLLSKLKERGILPFRSFTMGTHPDIQTDKIEKILQFFQQ